MTSAAWEQKRADRAERLRVAGEEMFKVLVHVGCVHSEPRSPIRDDCQWCRRKAAAMDAWDDALMGAPSRAFRRERKDG